MRPTEGSNICSCKVDSDISNSVILGEEVLCAHLFINIEKCCSSIMRHQEVTHQTFCIRALDDADKELPKPFLLEVKELPCIEVILITHKILVDEMLTLVTL